MTASTCSCYDSDRIHLSQSAHKSLRKLLPQNSQSEPTQNHFQWKTGMATSDIAASTNALTPGRPSGAALNINNTSFVTNNTAFGSGSWLPTAISAFAAAICRIRQFRTRGEAVFLPHRIIQPPPPQATADST